MTEPGTRGAVVVLISGRGSNLQALLDAARDGFLSGDISCVISNQAGARGLVRAAAAGIPSVVVAHCDFNSRDDFDAELARRIARYCPALVVLAGFMRVLGADIVRRFEGRMINIHPSLLPVFPGLQTHQRAIEAGVAEHGASVHYVTPDLDGGPVIAQAHVPVLPKDTAEDLAARVLEQEHRLLPQVVQWILEGRVNLVNGKVHFDGLALAAPKRVH